MKRPFIHFNLRKLYSIILSPDLWISITVSLLILFLAPNNIRNEFLKDVYGVGVTVLSIVFSVYFAALAIIISSGDDDFIDFLEQEGEYSLLLSGFRFVLNLLLIALLYSIVLYSSTSILIITKYDQQPKYFFVVFVFFLIYSLLSTYFSTNDSINYALYRAKFLRKKREMKSQHEQNKKEDSRN